VIRKHYEQEEVGTARGSF